MRCPRCGKSYSFTKTADHPFFPFCSRVCKLIDLGAWLDEKYTIEGPPHLVEHDNGHNGDHPFGD